MKREIRIMASVTATVELAKGETEEQFKNRLVDIYLHSAGEDGAWDKTDLGVDDATIEFIEDDKFQYYIFGIQEEYDGKEWLHKVARRFPVDVDADEMHLQIVKEWADDDADEIADGVFEESDCTIYSKGFVKQQISKEEFDVIAKLGM